MKHIHVHFHKPVRDAGLGAENDIINDLMGKFARGALTEAAVLRAADEFFLDKNKVRQALADVKRALGRS